MILGCGGHHHHDPDPTEVTTGSSGGRLADIVLSPAPGTTFISRVTTFRLSWPNGVTPPETFTVALYRYNEGCDCDCSSDGTTDTCSSTGDVDQGQEIESSDLTTVDGTTYTYDLKRTGDLDEGGTYFVELVAGTEQVRASYIVTHDRAVATGGVKRAHHTNQKPLSPDQGVHTVIVSRARP